MPLDPLYAVKGAKVQLARGVTVNSNIGPVEGGASKVPQIEAVVKDGTDQAGRPVWRPWEPHEDKKLRRTRPVVDEDGEPVLVDNPKPQPQGVLFNRGDSKGYAPVKWPDGSWSNVRFADLELVEPAPEHIEKDPVRARAADHRSNVLALTEVAARVEQLERRADGLVSACEQHFPLSDKRDAETNARVDELEKQIAALRGELTAAVSNASAELARLVASSAALAASAADKKPDPPAVG